MDIVISGSIVLYKTDKRVKSSIESFLNTTLPVKLFLIDNSPTQEIKEQLRDLLQDGRVEYIFSGKNIGFGAGHNKALRKAPNLSLYHLVLNPDVHFDIDVLGELYSFMEANKDVGLVIPKVIYPDGSLQYLSKLLPSPSDLIFRRFLPSSVIKKRLFNYEMQFSGYDKKMEVPYISGCFMFMRTSTLQTVGLFDERFFLYLEDTDLSRRFFLAAKNIYYPDVQIVHYHERGSYKNLGLLFIHIANAFRYFNKWGWWRDKERKLINNKAIQGVPGKALPQNSLKVKVV
ncbi:glycosyltransferase family 2 protein [Segetibacter koreensis]|uniref:glycosyltransferase family 2 protein n=1 Tax=Segetibacter koreensis TaxID=398037 RepID=UPI00035D5EEE|nr:glycosyltransferase family 2 protein [Segetibacter koreensis]